MKAAKEAKPPWASTSQLLLRAAAHDAQGSSCGQGCSGAAYRSPASHLVGAGAAAISACGLRHLGGRTSPIVNTGLSLAIAPRRFIFSGDRGPGHLKRTVG